MKIETFVSQTFEANCYLVIDNNKAIVIDPCVKKDYVLKKYPNIDVVGVFITHSHYDHISCLESYDGICMYIHKNGISKLSNPTLNCSTYLGYDFTINWNTNNIKIVHDELIINILDNYPIKIIETKGHTDCSICLIIDNCIFSGDTLFKNSIGRTDFPTGSTIEMSKSLDKLSKLKSNYEVYPGHEEQTTLDYEKIYNIYMKRL